MGMASLNTSPRKGRRRSSAGFSEINVTPLVDVMLVLLIIFMVAAPMLTVGVPVDLPKTKAAKMNDQVEPVVVSVDASGRTFLQETAIGDEGLIARLMAITSNNPDARIYVRGDQSLAYGRVMEVMGEIAAAGFTKVSLIAEMPTAAKAASAPHAPLPAQRQAKSVPQSAAKVPTLQQIMPSRPQHLPSARPNAPQNSQQQVVRPQGQALSQRPPLPRPSGG